MILTPCPYDPINGVAGQCPYDRENYVLLLQELREALGPEKLITVPHLWSPLACGITTDHGPPPLVTFGVRYYN